MSHAFNNGCHSIWTIINAFLEKEEWLTEYTIEINQTSFLYADERCTEGDARAMNLPSMLFFLLLAFVPGTLCQLGNCGWERPQILLIQVFDREGLSSVSIDNNNCRKNQLLQFYNCIIVMPFISYYFLVNYLYAYINYSYWCSVSTNIHTIELLHVQLAIRRASNYI